MKVSADAESLARTSLNGHGIFAIIVFAVVALICIQPIHIPVPHKVAGLAQRTVSHILWQTQAEIQPEQSNVQQAAPPDPLPATGSHPEEDGDRTPIAETGPSRTRHYVTLNHVWTPAIGILFLLATKTIGGEQIRLGIVGEEGVEPYDVLALFLGLAYIAISLDATGLLRYLAFQVCLKAGTSGRGLYLILYAFFWTLGVLVGNDPVILSGTAFLVYLTRVAGISPPSAWIWAQFVAANISSAVLVSSNPTNLVIASGFGISFPVYTAYMILPAFISALVSLLALLVFFRNRDPPKHGPLQQQALSSWCHLQKRRKNISPSSLRDRSAHRAIDQGDSGGVQMDTLARGSEQMELRNNANECREKEKEARRSPIIFIPKTIVRPDVDARAALVDLYGAVFASIIMAATLVTLIATSVTGGVKVYMIAAPGAGVCLVRDIVYDLHTWRKVGQRQSKRSRKDAEQTGPLGRADHDASSALPAATVGEDRVKDASGSDGLHSVAGGSNSAQSSAGQDAASASQPHGQSPLGRVVAKVCALGQVFPTVAYVAARLPLPLLPFAFGMFILVQSLAHVGFINILAKGLGDVCTHGYVGCSFFLSTLGVILCNVSGIICNGDTRMTLITAHTLTPYRLVRHASWEAPTSAPPSSLRRLCSRHSLRHASTHATQPSSSRLRRTLWPLDRTWARWAARLPQALRVCCGATGCGSAAC